MPHHCDHLVIVLLGYSKVATTYKFPYGSLLPYAAQAKYDWKNILQFSELKLDVYSNLHSTEEKPGNK